MKKRHKRKLRKPVKRVLLFIILVILFSKLNTTEATSRNLAREEEQYITYIVQPGDRLWLIAKKYKTPGTDTREKIFEIEQTNKDKDLSYIYPGQEITIKIEP